MEKIMKEFILIRHGETDFNRKQKFMGRSDVPLNETGKKQASNIKLLIQKENISKIYSSDLLRCRETAEIIEPDKIISYHKELREMNFGIFEGLTYDDIKKDHQIEIHKWKNDSINYRIPGGESLSDMSDRVLNFFQKLVNEYKEKTIIISHSGSIRIILAHYIVGNLEDSWKFFIDNSTITRIGFDGNYAYLKSLNEK
jgi:alpha-ribazole phosphatase